MATVILKVKKLLSISEPSRIQNILVRRSVFNLLFWSQLLCPGLSWDLLSFNVKKMFSSAFPVCYHKLDCICVCIHTKPEHRGKTSCYFYCIFLLLPGKIWTGKTQCHEERLKTGFPIWLLARDRDKALQQNTSDLFQTSADSYIKSDSKQIWMAQQLTFHPCWNLIITDFGNISKYKEHISYTSCLLL